jgi:ATP-dependent DNA helicase DinG
MSWVDQSIKSLHDIGKNYSPFIKLLDRLDSLPHLLLELKQFYAQVKPMLENSCADLLPELAGAFQMPHKRFENGVIPQNLQILAQESAKRLLEIVDDMSKAHEMIGENLEENVSGLSLPQLEQLYAIIGQMLSTADRHLSLWQAYAKDLHDIPDSRWIQLVEAGGLIDFELSASPLLASGTLTHFLWNRCYAAILTSATLTALGEFNRIKMHMGLPDFTQTSVVLSPFDYPNKAQFIVPAMQSDATDHLRHSDEIAALLPSILLQDKAALVLFSSKKQLKDVYETLDSQWQPYVLRQSAMSKQALLDAHREAVDKDQRSIVFGLASFAEGVDLPGKYCTHVVIAKLPFSVPNDPVESALAEWFESRGRNPFNEISLPAASQKLIQACGRLIRTESDSGKVTLLDKRILT